MSIALIRLQVQLMRILVVLLTLSLTSIFCFAQGIKRDSLIKKIEYVAFDNLQSGKSEIPDASELEILFGKAAEEAGMTILDVREVYSNKLKEVKPKKNWWDDFIPNIGWLAAIILFFLLILRDLLKKFFTQLFTSIGNGLYNSLAGKRFFWRFALTKYRKFLVEFHQELKIPFRSGKPLEMADVYVPLKVSGTSDHEQINALQALGEGEHLVILGAPGSGKTMLMRHLALRYARQGLNYIGQPIPILLELHRLSDRGKPILEHLQEVLARHKFPKSKKFLKVGMEKGLLMFLFDGLDEVNQDVRDEVVQQIKDFSQQAPHCRVVVSCRTAVYQGEFASWSDQQLEIVEFNDQQIQRFLGAWASEMPAGKSVENLIQNLQDRPRIMTLARNPLLLTIIAYLYSDTAFVLPHSRAEFYQRSTDLLLDQWDQFRGNRNVYTAPHKRLVLQALALMFQERGAKEDGQDRDRRSVPLGEVLEEVKKVLSDLNLEPKHAQSILDEIVDRSGLLIEIDGGERYQFTHLTLQEYFVAQALKGTQKALLDKFVLDPATWREIAKLWCGLDQDSTTFIEEVSQNDPITALECLGDAQQINVDQADAILNSFFEQLGIKSPNKEAIEKAFAIVAADTRPRGKDLFQKLVAMLKQEPSDSEKLLTAANILYHTNLPQAATVFAQQMEEKPELRLFLIQMGNLAVPSLVKYIQEGELWAFDALYEIGTVEAAIVMVPILWDRIEFSKYIAAWRLGSLVKNVEIYNALADIKIPDQVGETLDWVWEPFLSNSKNPQRIILGRISYLISVSNENTVPDGLEGFQVDERISIPLCTILDKYDLTKKFEESDKKKIRSRLEKFIHFELGSNVVPIAEEFGLGKTWLFLIQGLSIPKQIDLLKLKFSESREPNISDWRNINKPIEFSFERSHQYWGGICCLFVVAVLTIISDLNFISDNKTPGLPSFLGVLSICFLLGCLALLIFGKDFFDNALEEFNEVGLLTAFKILSNFILGPGVGAVLASYAVVFISISDPLLSSFCLWIINVLVGIIYVQLVGLTRNEYVNPRHRIKEKLLLFLVFFIFSIIFIYTIKHPYSRTELFKHYFWFIFMNLVVYWIFERHKGFDKIFNFNEIIMIIFVSVLAFIIGTVPFFSISYWFSSSDGFGLGNVFTAVVISLFWVLTYWATILQRRAENPLKMLIDGNIRIQNTILTSTLWKRSILKFLSKRIK